LIKKLKAMQYFKQVSQNMVFDQNGQQIQFSRAATGIGLIQLDEGNDAGVIGVLDACADARRSGIVRISAEIYEAEKKKTSSRPSQRRLDILGQLRTSKPPEPFRGKQAAVEFVENTARPATSQNASAAQEVPSFAALRARARKQSEVQVQIEDFETP
jgi:hypothetical protein